MANAQKFDIQGAVGSRKRRRTSPSHFATRRNEVVRIFATPSRKEKEGNRQGGEWKEKISAVNRFPYSPIGFCMSMKSNTSK
jgi:hypothetical protein